MTMIWEVTTDNGDDLGLYKTHLSALWAACDFIKNQSWTEEEKTAAIKEIMENDYYDGVVYVRDRELWD